MPLTTAAVAGEPSVVRDGPAGDDGLAVGDGPSVVGEDPADDDGAIAPVSPGSPGAVAETAVVDSVRVAAPDLSAEVAVIVSSPAVVDAVTVTEHVPEADVVQPLPVKAELPLVAKDTADEEMGWPFASCTVAVTVEVEAPSAGMVEGSRATVTVAGAVDASTPRGGGSVTGTGNPGTVTSPSALPLPAIGPSSKNISAAVAPMAPYARLRFAILATMLLRSSGGW